MTRTYLDYNASVPIKPLVLDLMREIMAEQPGNAAAGHSFGRAGRARIETAREQVAAMAGANPSEVIFTSGATEGNNAVMKAFRGKRILISEIEHPSVFESAPEAERIPVTKDGVIDIKAFEALIDEGEPPALISVMLVNNETGIIQPVAELAAIAREKHPDVLLYTDAVQAAGRISMNMKDLGVDYMTLSAHKIGGPQGVGALIAASGAPDTVLLHGSGQERRRRSGTENTAGVAGFGCAAELAVSELESYQDLATLRQNMEEQLQKEAPEAVIFGQNADRVANTTCLALPDVPAAIQLMTLDLDGIAISSGAACSGGDVKPSHVLKAMNADSAVLSSALRISMGWGTRAEDTQRFLESWLKMRNDQLTGSSKASSSSNIASSSACPVSSVTS